MDYLKHLFILILLNTVICSPQINLYFTDWVGDKENDLTLQHNCLYGAALIGEENDFHQVISYCMSELSTKWNIEKSNFNQIFTFAELSKQQITSQQLYLWSAPIDIIESYQLFLNQLSNSIQTSLSTELFYNCTLPRFGSVCEYEFDFYHSDYSSLNEMIDHFYQEHKYKPNTLTCYTHLQCNRGPFPACLDWSEICDGKIDCLDGGHDEEHCWQLEINECEENQYRCANGQCIPFTFFRDEYIIPDCLDGSDEILKNNYNHSHCNIAEPTFQCEDIICGIRSHVYGTPLTSSCVEERTSLLLQAIFSSKPKSVGQNCWRAFKCWINMPIENDPTCLDFCQNEECKNIIQNSCHEVLNIPDVPILFGHVHFIYRKSDFALLNNRETPSPYVCYSDARCHGLFDSDVFPFFNNSTCIRLKSPNATYIPGLKSWINAYLIPTYKRFWKCNSIIYSDSNLCHRSNMYQCVNSSKCISIYRLGDGIPDCYFSDDEELNVLNKTNALKLLPTFFKCTGIDKYISYYLVENGQCDCSSHDDHSCDDEYPAVHYARNHISFQTICDGFTELLPIIIDGQSQTDETECEQWLCNNTYTRCDGIWNCLNGADEINCDPSPLINCSFDSHICVSPSKNELMCLSIDKANNRIIDCVGATDEPKLCRSSYHESKSENFYCNKNSREPCIQHENLCDGVEQCENGDDEKVCDTTRNYTVHERACDEKYALVRSDVEKFLCKRLNDTNKQRIVYFLLDTVTNSLRHSTEQHESATQPSSTIIQNIDPYPRRCHRGIDLRVWLDDKNNFTTCLCPPSFYGNNCRYQNERISLTLQFRALSDSWQIPFIIIILLIDNNHQRIIHSYEQFTYLSMRDCQTKFHNYLLYSTRPKNPSNNYSIHIDIYQKISLGYRGSFLVPISHPFLPVHRLALQFTIPQNNKTVETCSKHQCIHGRCVKYSNDYNNKTFCQCKHGWSGQYCTISHHCSCSSDSLCIGILPNNRPICICPMNKFGPQCFLTNKICQLNENNSCLNGGQCIPHDEHLISNKRFTCICRKGFTGDRCEIHDNKIIVSFDKNIRLPPSMLIHFIQMMNNSSPKRSTTFKILSSYKDSIVIYWSHPFHIVFIELFNKTFYLTVLQSNYQQSMTITKTLQPSDRCQHVNETFNRTINQLHLLRRIKYYHLPCQKGSLDNLSCFYDDIHICLCDYFGEERQANCFEFDHQMKLDCFGQSGCENGAQCFQDSPTCPQTSICVCPTCFYGRRCQFSTTRFGLSLDAILGYKIQPHIRITHQPVIVQVTLVLTILMTIIGFISSILSIITFKNKRLHEVGSGIYLFGSSISTLLTMLMFALKFFILLGAQMESIVNRSFIYFQCISIDFFLRISLNMDHWLNACVACERAITSIKATKFNKRKSQKSAKYVILALLILMICTTIHDPLHRRLINDTDENGENKRIWCIVSYSSSVEAFNSTVNIFHFFAPFLINLISALVMIKSTARQRAIIQPQQTPRQHLHDQFQKYIHLLIAPVLLVILALPRLIISLVSGCMKSVDNSWLFVTGYFISFIPPMLTFILFILPTKSYKKEFGKSIKYFRRKMRARVQPIS